MRCIVLVSLLASLGEVAFAFSGAIPSQSISVKDLAIESLATAGLTIESTNFLVTRPEKLINNNLLTNVSAKPLEIGTSSFFESPAYESLEHRTLSTVGASYEDRANMSDAYVFFNQLLPNNIFYELRAYAAYNYITQNPAQPSIPVSDEANPMGFAGVAILGYNIDVSSRVSLLPFLWLSYMDNFVAVYRDTQGNAINSTAYNGYLGMKMSMKVTKQFAVYALYMAGYQSAQLYGQGIYSNGSSPTINQFVSATEFGLPYRLSDAWSFTPYIRINTTSNYPNAGAEAPPYGVNSFTTSVMLLGLKLGYGF